MTLSSASSISCDGLAAMLADTVSSLTPAATATIQFGAYLPSSNSAATPARFPNAGAGVVTERPAAGRMARSRDTAPERIERNRSRREDHHGRGREPGGVQQHQRQQQREPGAGPDALLIGGGLAPEAVNELDGDARQQDQPCRAIGLRGPDRRREREQGEQPCEGRQARGPDESAGGHVAVIRSNGRLYALDLFEGYSLSRCDRVHGCASRCEHLLRASAVFEV